MTRRARRLFQFVVIRDGMMRVDALAPRPARAPRIARRHRSHFVELSTLPPDPARPSIAPQAFLDKMSKFDSEQGRIGKSDRTGADKELNATAFENDVPWRNRPSRANVGFAAIKAKGWR